jgi:hypothetical protein
MQPSLPELSPAFSRRQSLSAAGGIVYRVEIRRETSPRAGRGGGSLTFEGWAAP